MRAVITPNGRFASVADASRAHGVTRPAGKRRVEHQTHGWRYDDEDLRMQEYRKFFAIYGDKRSVRDAFLAGYDAAVKVTEYNASKDY